MQKVIIYGGSGFVGSYLVPALEQQGYFVIVCDRYAPDFDFRGEFIEVDIMQPLIDQWAEEAKSYLSNPYTVINLAGKNIFGKFTPEHKQTIYDSRITGTRRVLQTFQEARYKPRVYITASAVGYYGNKGNNDITEQSAMGRNYLASVVADWEGEARHAEDLGIRLVIMRQGHILGAGGIIGVLKPYYAKGFGGPIGNGKFYFPWIHVEDVAGYYVQVLAQESMRGVYNLVTGEPITYRQFSKAFATALHRPHIARIPKFLLKVRFGEFADEMTASQKIIPQRILTTDYQPIFQDINEAMEYQVGR
ncbi:TIGR01777 family protein [Candidatus Nomurabacteria bacterium]|nr:TIGR01777 family protein [Candidatus Nomurabacteria bacterium]